MAQQYDTIPVELDRVYEIPPAGKWRGTLDTWEIVENRFNPSQPRLLLTFLTEVKGESGDYLTVRAYSPAHLGARSMLGQLARAAASTTGLDPDEMSRDDPRLQSYPIGQLVGVQVGIEVTHTEKDGRTYANAARICTLAEVQQHKAALRRQQAAIADTDNDPFAGE